MRQNRATYIVAFSSETGLRIPFGLRRLPPNVGRVTNHLSSFRATSSSAGFDMLILFLY
jgi:hypothetical protein